MSSITKLTGTGKSIAKNTVTGGPAGTQTGYAGNTESKTGPGCISAGEHFSKRIRKKEKRQQRTGDPNDQQNNYESYRSALIYDNDFRE